MRFGLFYEHQMPRPWDEDAEERALRNALDQIELADRTGWDYAWEVEHHFLEEYSHSSAPEVFLAAASQRTERIRLGHGIVQLPPPVNHPARIAERIATLDLISGGRVDFGSGEGSSQAELGGFGVERSSKRDQWREALDAVTRMFVEEPFAGYEGRFVSMPPRNVVPKPKQRPHPPLWVACSRRETILLAAQLGLGALSFSFVEPEQAKEWADEYYAIVESEECVPAGFAVNPSFAVALPMMVHEDEQTAIERGIDGAHFFGYSLAHYYVFGEHRPARTNVWDEFAENRDKRGFARDIVTPDQAPLGVKLLQHGFGSLRGAVGTPQQVIDLVERYERAGVDQVIFALQAGPNRHEHVCESIELVGERVIPHFAERRDEREAAKRERLAPAIERALARRDPPRAPEPGYTISPQGEPRPATVIAAARRDGRGNGRASLSERAAQLGQAALASFVRGRSDGQLDKLIGSDAGLRMIFKGMERAFVPSKTAGFSGDLQYEIETSRGTRKWVVHVDDGRAVASPGEAEKPAMRMKATAPMFARVITEEVNPARALIDGEIQMEGDIEVLGRIGEMFGGEGMW
jgi:alkanesulfonate monooxygenase SsuD/methylene tetrahydromethanopterin reductase-like flavin-dependent oxidoreductase (luciferase family)